jgi:hypothetical protein
MVYVKPLGGALQFRMWVTRGCFFVLSDRLKRKSRYSIAAITTLSFCVFVFSFFALIVPFASSSAVTKEVTLVLSILSLVISVFIILITLLENSKDYSLYAENAYQIAHDLEELYNQYEAFLAGMITGSETEVRLTYSKILRRARVSRKSIDYQEFKLKNREAFGLTWKNITPTAFAWTIDAIFEYWIYFTMIAIPLATVVVVARYLFPKIFPEIFG